MRMSENELEAHLNKHNKRKISAVQPSKSKSDVRVLGRLKQGVMNQTERKYAGHLESLKIAGEILYYAFDSMKFRLADKTFYSPDFIVLRSSGELEAHEVKGHWEDDARVKIKVAASMHPIPFIAVKWNSKNNNWDYENF
ncbi:hypothetical protein [Acinetobacter larvae]|uniref:DUF1064 domain-containing protein n=1 Tax=Acinetobacter larvae TaxID=1789224 RepID=A0A1B2M3T0_9GAMM|nr:hypothetical protein [Acinetobacter larvae]AOA59860.1 hypothetical protein BFG52_03805 [Acinetobacter larvae]